MSNCYNCKNRHVGCHSTCSSYAKEKAETIAKKQWLRETAEVTRSIEYRLRCLTR